MENTTEQLLGKWCGEYTECFSGTSREDNRSFRRLTIEFKPNHTLQLFRDKELIQTAEWQVVESYYGLYGLEVTPPIWELVGPMLFCTDRLEFHDTPWDGCDKIFRRAN